MITRRSIMALLGIAPATEVFASNLRIPGQNPDATFREGRVWPSPWIYTFMPLTKALERGIHEFDPNGGDMGRGPRILKQEVPVAATILNNMGFRPYSLNDPDPLGEPFPLYGCSGGLTTLAMRIWVRQTGEKHEAVCLEYIHDAAFEGTLS